MVVDTNNEEKAKDELKSLMDSIPIGICRLRYEDGLLLESANEGMFSLLKMSPEEFAQKYGNHYERLLDTGEWNRLRERIESGMESGEVLQAEYACHCADRQTEWHQMQALVLKNGDHLILQCVLTDITEMKHTRLLLGREKEKLNLIAEISGNLLFEYDIEKDRMEYSEPGEGLPEEELIGQDYVKRIREPGRIHPADSEKLEKFCEELRSGRKHIYVELRKKSRDGEYHWIEIEGITVNDLQGKPLKVIGRSKNIDERKTREEKFRLDSERDFLTGLYNHQAVMRKIRERLDGPDCRLPGWLILADVDNFRLINDTNGHLVGDAVLCMVADELKNSFKGSLLGRVGSDKFIALVEGVSKEELEGMLGILTDTIQGVYRDKKKNLEVSCSIGVVKVKGNIRNADALYEWAEYALYKMKQEKRRGYYITEAEGDVPEGAFYLREAEEEYVREEALISSADELVLFTLELLGNVADVKSGLKMASDRICSFFDIDDIVYIYNENGEYRKQYHWSRQAKRETEQNVLQESMEAWRYIEDHFDEKGIMVLRREEISHMPGRQVGSILFVRPGKGSGEEGCIAYVDRKSDRDWVRERDALVRLSGIVYNQLQHMYELERRSSEAERKVNYDPVTGLLRYQRFVDLTAQYMKSHADREYYFVYSDFANFQYVNEIYGYTEGDKILIKFAEWLKKQEHGIYFSRVTSDHFVGFLSGGSEGEVRKAYLQATEEFCEQMNRQYDQNNLLIVSGFSKVMDVHEPPSMAIDRANVARKYGKNTSHTVVVVYNQEIKERNEAERAITANMAAALENGEFKAWLQPKISLITGKVVGAEALVRWQRADGTMIYPDSFIPVFEKNGFITRIDFAVLDQILSYLREAMDEGEPVVPVSVNFSRRHNENPDFVDQVLRRLRDKDIPPEYIEAEITESIFMLDLTALTSNLRRLKENGITISIDDFGSGYSSLNVLANVDADVIKLDKKFLAYAGEDSRAPVFVKSLVRMIKKMGYKVLVEGVETREQLSLLSNAECDMVQGYYYARPMPVADFRKYLKEFNRP